MEILDDGIHLSLATVITYLDDQYAVTKFSKSGVYEKVPQESTLIYADTGIFSYNTVQDWLKEAVPMPKPAQAVQPLQQHSNL